MKSIVLLKPCKNILITLFMGITFFYSRELHAQSGFPLEVRVILSPPYPTHYSDFTDYDSRMFIEVNNTTTNTYRVVFMGSLENLSRGIKIESNPSNPPRACIDILPGMNMISGADLTDLFDANHLLFSGITADRIRADEALPEGEYKLCLRAHECNNIARALSAQATDFMGCESFETSFPDPPQVIAPGCGSTVDASDSYIKFVWNWIPPATGYSSIDFTIRLIEIWPESRSAEEAFLSATTPDLFTAKVSNVTSYDMFMPEDVTLEYGKRYAFKIIVSDPEEEIIFKNGGESEACSFTYQGFSYLGDGGTGPVQPVYPLDGDYIPFDFIPFVMKFYPYNPDYRSFNSEFSLFGPSGLADDHNRSLRWPDGPLESQQRSGLSDITLDQASHIAVYKNQTESPYTMTRGVEYGWTVDGFFDLSTGGSEAFMTNRQDFVRGMSAPVLQEPADGASLPPGEIKFGWQQAKRPGRLVPPFDIVQYSGGSPVTFFSSIVDEHWIFELSRSQSFDTIIHSSNRHISGYPWTTVADSSIIAGVLYQDVERIYNLTDTGWYYWRCKWLTVPGDTTSTPYSESPVWRFKIIEGATVPTPTTARDTSGGCISDCLTTVTNRTAQTGLGADQELAIGKFTLKVKSITSTSGNRYDGEGEVQVRFLNNLKIKVEFDDIQYNNEGQIFAGNVNAVDDISGLNFDSISSAVGDLPSSIPLPSETEIQALGATWEAGERLVSILSSSTPVGMPVGLDNEIDGVKYVIGITKMKFLPTKATMTAIFQMDIPELGDKLIALGANNICFTPGGLGDEGRLYLPRDWEIFQEGGTRFAFSGSERADTSQMTYIEWDCRGFKCMNIRGEVDFPREWLLPENDTGSVVDGNVKGYFGVKTCRGNNWLAEISIDRFQVVGMDGWGFRPVRAFIDLSDWENPPGMRFPPNYNTRSITGDSSSSPRLLNTWKGFWLDQVMMHVPATFEDDVLGRASFGIQNLIIDKTGLTMSILGLNIIDYDNGSVDGWAFSLDTAGIDIVQNSFSRGYLGGKLGVPVFDRGDYLHYSTALSYAGDSLSYNFSVFVKDTLNVPMWNSEMFLTRESNVRLTVSHSTKIKANLTGGINIEGDLEDAVSSVPGVNFQGIRFQGLQISSDEPVFGIDSFYIAHASPQKSVSGFPVNITHLDLNMNELDRPGLDFGLSLTLSDAGFHAEVGMGIFGRISTSGSGNVEFNFDGIDLQRIRIDQTINAIKLAGEIAFYKNDPTYGNGVKGMLDVTLPMDLAVHVGVQFGTIQRNNESRFNTPDYFSYWFVDGMLYIPGGIQIFSGFALYGLGGGAYHHMRITREPPPAASTLTAGTESSRSSTVYEPHFDTFLGLKISAVLGTFPKNDAFNMDATIGAEFTRHGGLAYIGIRADGYIMASLSQRADAKITASVEIAYHNPPDGTERVEGSFDVFADFYGVLKGGNPGNQVVMSRFYIDDEQWYFYIGRPDFRGDLIASLGPIEANMDMYLMVGYGIPATLPPLPDDIARVLYGPGQSELNTGAASTGAASTREMPPGASNKIQSGQGFAFGTTADISVRFDFAIFYAQLRTMLGMDINVSYNEGRICAETGLAPGINNWYAQGQIFAGLWGEMGVQVDLFFIKGEFPFISLAAAIMMQGGLPNPSYFNGRAGLEYSVLGGAVSGHCNFKFEVGEKCSVVNPNPLSDIEFIAEVLPGDGENDVSVFAYPTVIFNLPVEQLLEIPSGTQEEPDRVRVFKPIIHTFNVYNREDNSVVKGQQIFDEENTQLVYKIDEALAGNIRHTIEIEVKAREHFPNGTSRLVKDGSADWKERKEISFNTGERPDHIPEENLRYSYPIKRQAYFLQGESRQGVIRYHRSGQNYLFYETKDEDRFTYLAKFIPVDGGETIEVEIQKQQSGVYFNIPNLGNDKYYAIQILRRKLPRPRTEGEGIGSVIRENNYIQSENVRQLAPMRFVLDESIVNVRFNTRIPGTYARSNETILYHYHFRTSKYNTLTEKLQDTEMEKTYVNSFVEAFKLEMRIPEHFDQFDIKGFYKNGEQVIEPLVQFGAPFTYGYHTTRGKYVYQLKSAMEMVKRTDPVLRNMRISRLNSTRFGTPPEQTVFVSSTNRIADPVQDWEISRAAGVYENSTTEGPAGSSSSIGTYGLNITNSAGISEMMYSGSASVTSGFLSGSISNSILSGSASRTGYRFQLEYGTSNFVKLDATRLKSDVTRILSTYRFPQGYVYRDQLRKEHNDLYWDMNRLLNFDAGFFNYSSGEYGVRIRYHYPVGTGTGYGSYILKEFSHGLRAISTVPLRVL